MSAHHSNELGREPLPLEMLARASLDDNALRTVERRLRTPEGEGRHFDKEKVIHLLRQLLDKRN